MFFKQFIIRSEAQFLKQDNKPIWTYAVPIKHHITASIEEVAAYVQSTKLPAIYYRVRETKAVIFFALPVGTRLTKSEQEIF